MEILDRIASGYSLPSLSPVATKLVSVAANENVSINELAEIIEKDPALTVRLLRLANSAFFRVSSPVMSINQAISLMGINRLRVMALSLSLRDTFPMGRVGPMDYEEFWRSSLYQALIAKSLASRLKSGLADGAFVAGLTLEIGLLIFYDLLIKGKQDVYRLQLHPIEPLLQWEKEQFGLTHRDVGEAALRFWNFPDEIIMCQRSGGLEGPATGLMRVCAIARECSALICQTSMEWQPLFRSAQERYQLDQDMLGDILVTTFEEVQEIAESLKVQMNRKQDLMDLMDKAHRALSELSDKILALEQGSGAHGMPAFSGLNRGDASVKETLQAVAHEIRNPLTAVGGFARRLSKSLEPASEEWRYAQVILEESDRLEKTLSSMAPKGGGKK